MPDATSPQGDSGASAKRRRWILWGLVGLAAVAVIVIGGIATLTALMAHGERNVERVEVDGIESTGDDGGSGDDGGEDVEEIDQVLHVLLVGSDRRDGLSSEDRQRLGTGEADGNRTDTIMLMRLDPSTEEVSVLSFPRDLLVTRCDGSRGKINAAYHVGESADTGGGSCLVQTVTGMTGLSVHHLVEVDFAGFLDVVDIVDGVTVYLEEPIHDPLAHLDLDEGCHQLTGVEALGFVRHRASDSDYGRIARQQRFIKELVREASSLSSVINVPRMFRLVETGASAVTTDESLTVEKMRRIAFTLRDLESENLIARTVPGEYERIDGVDYEVPLEDAAEQLYRAFEQGRLGEAPEDSELDPDLGDDHDDEGDWEDGDDTTGGEGDEGAADAERASHGADEGAGDDGAEDADDSQDEGHDSDESGGEANPPPGSEEFVGAQRPPQECR